MCVKQCECNHCYKRATCADCVYIKQAQGDCSKDGIQHCKFRKPFPLEKVEGGT